MAEAETALIALCVLVAASVLGLWLQPRLPSHYQSQPTIESVRLVITMLVTFAALVLGLLVSSAKADFDTQTDLVQQYSSALIELDARLRQYGPETTPIRGLLRTFTAALIADSWPDEPLPSGTYPTRLHPIQPGSRESVEMTALLDEADTAIMGLSPNDPFREKIAPILQGDIQSVEHDRWKVIEGDHPTITGPFVPVMTFWLGIVFLTFGLSSPRNVLVYAVIGLSAVSVASVLYVLLDLDSRLGGFIHLSSQPLRAALLHMDQSI